MFAFIAAEKANYPITWMCQKLKVARASFYRWLRPSGLSPRAARHHELTGHVRRVFDREKGKAGRDQIWRLLKLEGIRVAAATVGAIMRQLGLRAIRLRAWKKTTRQDPDARTALIANHMLDESGKRSFTADAPGQRLCGDITYLRTGEGWLYLATVIDLFNGEIIGWSMADHMRTSLIIDALAMARDHGHLDPSGAIFHSDRGAQGEFKWLSQHLVIMEVCDGTGQEVRTSPSVGRAAAVGGGSGVEATDAFTGQAGTLSRGATGFLAADRVGRNDGRGRGGRRCVMAGRVPLVPSRWRHAADQSG